MSTVGYENIPDELKRHNQWTSWRAEHRDGGKPTKIPIDVKTGSNAKVNDPTTWVSFEEAKNYHNKHHNSSAGIGFVFSEDDPFVGIDLDNCRDKETRDITPWGQELIDMSGTYSEVSPSGTGVKIYLKGTMPGKKGRRIGYQTGEVEMYAHHRFFTVTGEWLSSTPATISENNSAIEQIYLKAFGNENNEHKRQQEPKEASIQNDQDLIQKAMNAHNGDKFRVLWEGSSGGYTSASEADLALCAMLAFWTQGDAGRIDSLFRQSGLIREKWDEQHGDETYGAMTIRKAIESCGYIYDPNYHKASLNVKPVKLDEGVDGPLRPTFTEGWTAWRLGQTHGEDIRFCALWNKFLVWDGKRWATDPKAITVTQKLKKFIHGMYTEAAETDDEMLKKALSEHAVKFDNERKYRAVVELTKSELPITPDRLDANPMLLNCSNGTVDLKTGELKPHNKMNYCTKMCAVEFDINSQDDVFDNFIVQTLPNTETREFVQRAAGYSITGYAIEEVLFFPYGPTATGKSTLLAALYKALGDYAASADFDTLLAQATDRTGRPKTELARLHGKRFVQSVEVGQGQKLAEGLVKWITGQDTVVARKLYAEEFEFLPSFTLWLAANHRPQARDDDDAVWRRILQISFDQQVPKAKRNPEVKKRLTNTKEGRAAILAWAVKGCLEWQKLGLAVPRGVEHTTEEYREEMNPLRDFFDECCVIAPSTKATLAQLYSAYSAFCGEECISFPLGRGEFGKRLGADFKRGRARMNGKVSRFFLGIGIRETPGDESVNTVNTVNGTFTNSPIGCCIGQVDEPNVHNVHNVHTQFPPYNDLGFVIEILE